MARTCGQNGTESVMEFTLWAPLYALGGAPYILHIKGVGAYTDARLIPGYIRMSYIDWK